MRGQSGRKLKGWREGRKRKWLTDKKQAQWIRKHCRKMTKLLRSELKDANQSAFLFLNEL